MIRKKFSLIVAGVIFAFLLSVKLIAQPVTKINYKLSLRDRTNEVLVPFDYANYKKVGPVSRKVYTRIHNTEKTDNLSSVKTMRKYNFFLKLKGIPAHFPTVNVPYSQRKIVNSFFLDLKRHY